MWRTPGHWLVRMSLAALSMIAACGRPVTQVQPVGQTIDREFSREELGLDPMAELSAACPGAAHTISPLYHDCQAPIDNVGKYGPLVAVQIDVAVPKLTNDSFARLPRGVLRRLAYLTNKGNQPLVLRSNPTYAINPGDTHCAYFGARNPSNLGGDWRGTFDPACTVTVTPSGGDPFQAQRDAPFADEDLYPAAARLDEDTASNQRNRIIASVKCGAGWCNLAAPGSFARRDAPSPSKGWKRSVRGWYDQQILARLQDTTLVPSNVVGTLVPSDSLHLLADSSAFNDFRQVAFVHLATNIPGYEKFGFVHDSSNPANENEIKLKFHPGKPDSLKWEAMILTADGRTLRRRVLYHGPTSDVAGTGRWGWKTIDEVAWIRCGDGCCEITPFAY